MPPRELFCLALLALFSCAANSDESKMTVPSSVSPRHGPKLFVTNDTLTGNDPKTVDEEEIRDHWHPSVEKNSKFLNLVLLCVNHLRIRFPDRNFINVEKFTKKKFCCLDRDSNLALPDVNKLY